MNLEREIGPLIVETPTASGASSTRIEALQVHACNLFAGDSGTEGDVGDVDHDDLGYGRSKMSMKFFNDKLGL